MKLPLLLFLICYPILSFGQEQIIANDSIIKWETNKKLIWSDFLGVADENVFGYAMTSYKIEVIPSEVMVDENNNIQNYETLNVVVNFYKYHSWYIKDDIDLLNHEQLHFDIAEIFARKMRKYFKELQLNQVTQFSSYIECYNLFWEESRTYQKLYDSETRHGLDKEKNKQWSIKIKEELDLYNDYE